MPKTKSQGLLALFMILYQSATVNAASIATSMASIDRYESKHQPFSDQSTISSFFRNLGENETETDHHDEDHHDEGNPKPWVSVIAFTLLVNLATLSGVLFLIPMLSRKARGWVKSVFWNKALPEPTPQNNEPENMKGGSTFLDVSIPSFASGALLATSVFLMIPESLYLIQSFVAESEEELDGDAHRRFLEGEESEVHDEHSGEFSPKALWQFGASLLGGFMLPMLFNLLFSQNKDHFDGDICEVERFQDDEEGVTKTAPGVKLTSKVKYDLILSIILGDGFHNFCDGIFIGVALSFCDMRTAYVVVGVTLYHEIAQELADYFLLTRHAGLTPCVALSLNFASGLSVMVGGVAVLAASVSNLVIGLIISSTSGVYVYIACCECLPRVSEVVQTSKQRLLSMLMFLLGVVPIGIASLFHAHCDAGGH